MNNYSNIVIAGISFIDLRKENLVDAAAIFNTTDRPLIFDLTVPVKAKMNDMVKGVKDKTYPVDATRIVFSNVNDEKLHQFVMSHLKDTAVDMGKAKCHGSLPPGVTLEELVAKVY